MNVHIGDIVWITLWKRAELVENGHCLSRRPARILPVVPEGQPKAPEIASMVQRRFLRDVSLRVTAAPCERQTLSAEVALEPANHFRRLVIGSVTGFRFGSGEGAELAVPSIAQARDDVAPLVEV